MIGWSGSLLSYPTAVSHLPFFDRGRPKKTLSLNNALQWILKKVVLEGQTDEAAKPDYHSDETDGAMHLPLKLLLSLAISYCITHLRDFLGYDFAVKSDATS